MFERAKMKGTWHRKNGNVKLRLISVILVPMLCIPLVGYGYTRRTTRYSQFSRINYAQVSDEDESIRIIDGIVTYYKGYGEFNLKFDENTLYFEDAQLAPGWELELQVKIHNDGVQPLYIGYEIYYSWDEVTWIKVADPNDPWELYDEFRIRYQSELYDEIGELWDPDQKLKHCEVVINVEHLVFDAQDRPDLQGKTFTIKVEILGSMTR